MKIHTICILILALSCNVSFAQNKLTGFVTNSVTDETLPDVTIYISDLKKVVTTGPNGDFEFSGLPEGYFQFQFSLIGYKTYTLNVEINKTSEPIEVKLVPTELSTEEILVTDSSVVKPYQSEKIKAKDLQREGAMNVSEALTRIPGVWQLSTGTGISKPVIRGLYGDRIGIMINGIRFDNQQWQDEHGLVLSSDGIDNIEVIKGPRSLLFGPEAIGGVVSITDEHPAPVGTNAADINLKTFSNTLGLLADVGLKGAEKNFNWLVRFGGETHADYLDGNGIKIPETRFGGYTIKTSGGYNKGIWVGQLDYSYTSYTYGILEGREFQNELMKTTETRFDRSFGGPHHVLKVHNTVFQNNFFAGKSRFKLNLGYTYNQRQEVEGADERFLPDSLRFGNLDMILNTFSADAAWIYTMNRSLNFTVGTQEFTQTNRNYGDRRLIPDANVSSYSGTAMMDYSKGNLGIEAGFRYDMFKVKTDEFGVKDSIDYFPQLNLSYNSINGSAGATYRLNKNIMVKADLSTGFRAPNMAELTSNGLHEGTFQYEIGNNDFKSEQSVEGDVGLVIDGEFLSGNFSVYDNKINNFIYLGQTTDTLRGYPVFRFNQSDANLKGVEAELVFKPSRWLSFRGNYSTVIATRADGHYLPLIPADRISLGAHIEFKSYKHFYSPYFELTTNSTLRKTRLGDNETSLPGYVLLDADLGFDLRFEKQLINVSISCNNLLDKTYLDFMSRIKILSATYGGYKFDANNMGRNIVVSVKIPFKLSY